MEALYPFQLVLLAAHGKDYGLVLDTYRLLRDYQDVGECHVPGGGMNLHVDQQGNRTKGVSAYFRCQRERETVANWIRSAVERKGVTWYLLSLSRDEEEEE